jgi:photosystem II stability/assembly factor-like uncharacterized protein
MMVIPAMSESISQTEDFVYGLATSPDYARDGIVFAARSSGLYMSDDRVATWRPLYASLALTAPLPTAAVAVPPGVVADHHVFAGAPGAVLRSHNRGQTWEAAPLASPAPTVTALAISPDYEADGILFAGTAEDGVFRSKDRGARWGAWNFGLLDLNTLCLALSPAFGRDQTLFAGAESGIYRSTNGGRAWRDVEFSEDWAPVQCLAVSADYTHDGTVWAGAEACGLFVSRDHGDTWQQAAAEVFGAAVYAIVLSPAASDSRALLVLAEEGLVLSRDGGETWRRVATPDDAAITALAAPLGLDPGAEVLAGLMNGAVLRLALPA